MSFDSSSRRTVLKGIGAGTAALVGGVGTAAARGRKRDGASAEETIAGIVASNDNFNKLLAALEETGLDAVLDSDDDQYTVFGPTDDAFEDLLNTLDVTAEELLARDDLANILLYHVTEGRRYAASVVNAPRIEMLNGQDVPVDGTTLNEGQAEIVDTNIEASNGVVHVIDGVLIP